MWLDSTPIAVFTPDPANAANPPLIFYIHADHIDTPRVVVDKNNQIRWRWMAEPFGIPAAETNPSGLGVFAFNLRFPGQYYDQESGLHFNWNRFYDAGLGRYTTPDPLGLDAGDMSLYAYVGGDPLSFVDPMGLSGAGGSRPGKARPAPGPNRGGALSRRPVIGVFGCLGAFCVTSTPRDSDPQVSIELTLGGGIEICDPPKPSPPENMCKKSCGRYDPNCDDQVQPPGIPWPARFGGFLFGPSFKKDGRFCVRLGPHAGVPLVPSVDIGGMSER